MALLKITQKAIDKAKRPDEGWYLVEITKYEEKIAKPKPNKPQGMNAIHTLTLVTRVEGNEDVRDEEKSKDLYIPIGEDANVSFQFPYIEAVMEKPIEQLADIALDLEKDFLGKKLYAKVRHDIYKRNEQDKGIPTWEFEEYRPASQVPF